MAGAFLWKEGGFLYQVSKAFLQLHRRENYLFATAVHRRLSFMPETAQELVLAVSEKSGIVTNKAIAETPRNAPMTERANLFGFVTSTLEL